MSTSSGKAELYQAPLAEFIAERKRLAKDDKSLAKLPRPTVSAWAVNQLWWHARDAFDAFLASAEKLRKGDLRATAAHRDALAKLRARAGAMIKDAGHATTEATLRRVTQTLSAIAAGGWEPDEPGTISADRDPPGFGVPGLEAGEKVADTEPAKKKKDAERLAAERHRLEAALRTAKGDVHAREREVTHLEHELDKARRAVDKARAIVDDLEQKLTSRAE